MAQGKNTGIQIGMIVLAIISLISIVVAYMQWKHADEQTANYLKMESDLRNQETASRNRLDDINELKALIGANVEQVGRIAERNPATLVGMTVEQIEKTAGPSQQPTVLDGFARTRQEIDTLRAQNLDLTNQLQTLTAQYNALNDKYAAEAATHDTARTMSQTELAKQLDEKKEAVNRVQAELDAVDRDKKQLQVDFDDMKKQKDDEIAEKEVEIARLTSTNQRLQQTIEAERTYSFDVPDGEITDVNFDTNTVWINLGTDHGIRRGLTFSVYHKNLNTVGGKTSDIKAAVQITDTLGPKSSAATILWDDFSRPISRQDKIFTPLWRVGQQEVFALAGDFDIDGDGKDDTQTLINIIEDAGGKVKARLTKRGERTGEQITSEFKFLVIGDIGANAKDESQIINDEFDAGNPVDVMKKQASQSGVRYISMKDFLGYMGYRSQRRLWRPDGQMPFNLSAGVRDDQPRRSKSDLQSSGTVSGVLSRNPRLNNSAQKPRSYND